MTRKQRSKVKAHKIMKNSIYGVFGVSGAFGISGVPGQPKAEKVYLVKQYPESISLFSSFTLHNPFKPPELKIGDVFFLIENCLFSTDEKKTMVDIFHGGVSVKEYFYTEKELRKAKLEQLGNN